MSTEKIAIIENQIIADILQAELKSRDIPHFIKRYTDTALNGLFIGQKGWGAIYSHPENKDIILEILSDLEKSGEKPKLLDKGWWDICINCDDVQKSVDFYKSIGFKHVDGHIKDNWAIVVNSNLRLGLYKGHFEGFMLNFRGGDVFAIHEKLKNEGHEFSADAVQEIDGSVGATLKDPNGFTIYYNTHPDEVEKD